MGCKHNYVYTQGYFVCTKCGIRSHGEPKKKRGKKVAIVLGLFAVGLLAFASGIFDMGNIEESIKQTMPVQITDNIPPVPEIPIKDLTGKTVKAIKDISNSGIIPGPSQTTEEESRQALEYVNELRSQNQRPEIKWDSRVFSLAGAWSRELYETGQFDHTNPVTGNCPAILKGEFGLSANEDVADNLHSTGYISNPVLYNPMYGMVIDGWMDSPGHRYNLLYYDHVAGAYACHGGICAFMGLNHADYGKQCSTAAEGEAHFAKLKSCTQQQLSLYDVMTKDYSDDIAEYNRKVPSAVNSQSEYQFYMNWIEDLQRQEREIDNFRC